MQENGIKYNCRAEWYIIEYLHLRWRGQPKGFCWRCGSRPPLRPSSVRPSAGRGSLSQAPGHRQERRNNRKPCQPVDIPATVTIIRILETSCRTGLRKSSREVLFDTHIHFIASDLHSFTNLRAHKLKMNEILSHVFFTKICFKANYAVWWIQFFLLWTMWSIGFIAILIASPVSYECLLLNDYWLIDCLLACLLGWLIDWLIDWVIDWLIDWLILSFRRRGLHTSLHSTYRSLCSFTNLVPIRLHSMIFLAVTLLRTIHLILPSNCLLAWTFKIASGIDSNPCTWTPLHFVLP